MWAPKSWYSALVQEGQTRLANFNRWSFLESYIFSKQKSPYPKILLFLFMWAHFARFEPFKYSRWTKTATWEERWPPNLEHSLQILCEDVLVPKDRGNLPNKGFPSIYKTCPIWLVHFFRKKLTNWVDLEIPKKFPYWTIVCKRFFFFHFLEIEGWLCG